MRPTPASRLPWFAGALSLIATTGATPAVAHAETQSTAPTATIARVGADKRRLNIRAGQRAAVVGSAEPGVPGLAAYLQVKRGHRWRTLDKDSTAAGGRYVLRGRIPAAMSAPARVVLRWGAAKRKQRVGRLNSFRFAHASWYGPGLFGNRLGCGGTLTASRLGVAHKSLPCGTKLTLRHHHRAIRVRVIDRGPYVGGREFDLTQATARRLGFHGHGAILATR